MEATKSLYQSNFCRLCSEENNNGIDLFSITVEAIELSSIVNKYLPIKIEDDKKYPRRICPGCHIQLESMKLFVDLIIEGQIKLRNLLRIQQERYYKEARQKKQLEAALHNVNPNSSVESFTIHSDETGDKFLIRIQSDGPLFPPEHELVLQAGGLERPKRKRGRPPKPQVTDLGEKHVEQPLPHDKAPEENAFEDEGRRKRKIKAPAKFEGIVQGDELENILKKEGVLDDEIGDKGDEILVGRTESGDGEDLGKPVFFHTKRRSKIGYLKKKSKEKFECDICYKEFFNQKHFLLHKTNHNHIYICDDCGFGNEAETVIDQHQLETGHQGITVTEKPYVKIRHAELKPVESMETPSSDYYSSQQFLCVECKKLFSSKRNLEIHNCAVHNQGRPFVCPKCNKIFAYPATLKCHLKIHYKEDSAGKFTCETCSKVFQNSNALAYHKESDHGEGTRFVCTRCNKVFKHRQLLLRHQLVHTEKRPYGCKKCNATFKSQSNLANHQAVHTGIKKYVCKDCGQRYAHRTSLTLHQRWHDGRKPYSCEFCDKTFSQKGNLVEHKRIHTGEKPYCCDECGKSFTTSSQFQMHKKRHAGVKPWACDFCQKRFLHADSYKSHMNRHLEHRPHRCDVCERSFTEPWALKRHRRTHTGERPYRCDRCDMRFADSSNKCKHVRQHELDAGRSAKGNGGRKSAWEVRQLTDHQGNPISITTQDGKNIPVVTVGDDEDSIQGLMPDGTLVPIEISSGPEKEEPKVCVAEDSSSQEPVLMNNNTGLVRVGGSTLDPNIFVTDDSGQGICLVYAMGEKHEVDQQLAIDPLLIQSR